MTQCERILKYMKENGGITSMDAFRLGCTRLAARIADLRKDGHKIYAERISQKGITYCCYHLEDD